MLAFGIFITHGLACYVAIDLVWTNYVVTKIKNDSRKLLWEYVVRTLIVLVTCKLHYSPNRVLFLSSFCIENTFTLSCMLGSFTCRCNTKFRALYFVVWCIVPIIIGAGIPGPFRNLRLPAAQVRVFEVCDDCEKCCHWFGGISWFHNRHINESIGNCENIFEIIVPWDNLGSTSMQSHYSI